MITRQHRKSFARRLVLPLVAVGFVSYFGYHAFTGAFGIWAMDRLDADGARLAAQREELDAERSKLEAEVNSVRPESLDADVIDLKAREALTLMRPDEVVIDLGAAQQNVQ